MIRYVRSSITCIAILFVANHAHAAAGTAFGETSSVASLANAVSARPGDAGTILINPAGLADLREAMIVVGTHGDYVSQSFQRTGDASQDRSRGFGGYSFAAATPLPGWAHAICVGMALDVPAQYLLHIDVPVRSDQPISPMYDGPPDRLAGVFAIAVKALPRVEIGMGVAISPSLALPTLVRYVPGRGPSVNDNVEVRIDSSLDLAAAPFFGIRAQPLDWLGLSLVFRDTQASRATGTQTTIAGGILAPDAIDFYQLWDPASVVFGSHVAFNRSLSLSLDVAWHNWSGFRTAFDQPLAAPYAFHDTVSVASGLEARIGKGWALRGGVAVEPSPIPNQSGITNYIGGDTFVAAIGAGLDFRRFAHLPFMVDAHVRGRFDAPESATKDPNAASHADSTLPGAQIDNLGYPSFQSHTLMVQAGLTLSVFIGGGK